MPSPEESTARDDRVNDAILFYLQSVERGVSLDLEKFLAEHADVAEELKSFLGNQAQFQQVADLATLPPVLSIDKPSFDAEQSTVGFPSKTIPPVGDVVRYFGDYELLLEIARGGMGVVYKARQVNLNRVVALKMILAGQLAGPQDVQRFYTEAEAAAQLDHPGIVPVFEVGQYEGQHFFSMGFVEGQSLAALVADGPLPPREAAQMVHDVSIAIQYAHDKGVIHRDLKPGNILLDKDGRPRVTDFGLAKLTKSGSDLTGTGQILGTPSYMPPEQASGKTDQISPSADVYSLGAILYCLLTGRPPFQAANPLDTLLQVLDQEPVAPRQLNSGIPVDLETIVLKCLEKSVPRRYPSAKAIADELQRYLDGRPIEARPVSRSERAWRWCRRNPIIAGLSAAVAVSLILGIVVSSFFAWKEAEQAKANKELAIGNGKLADEKGALAETNRLLFESEREEKAKALHQLRIATAERLAAQSYNIRADSPELGLLLAVESGHITLEKHEGLLGTSHQALLDNLGTIGGQPLFGHQGNVSNATISPDSRWLVTGGSDQTACIWDLWDESPAATRRVLGGHQGPIHRLAITPDGRRLVTLSTDLTARVWDLTAENPADNSYVLRGDQGVFTHLAISGDSRWLITVSGSKTVRIWDLTVENPGSSARVLSGNQFAHSVAISHDGRWVVAASKAPVLASRAGLAPSLWLWDMAIENPESTPRPVNGHRQGISDVAISPDNRWLVTGSLDMTAKIWDLAANPNSEPRTFTGHEGLILCIAISGDGRWLVTGSTDKSVRVWDMTSESPDTKPRILNGHQGQISTVAISSDGHWVMTGSSDKTARIWDLSAQNPSARPRVLIGHQSNIHNVAVSSDNHWAVTTSIKDSTPRIWDLTSENASANPWVMGEQQLYVSGVGTSANGRWLAIGTAKKTVQIWDLTELSSTNPRVLNTEWAGRLAISDDGRWLVTITGNYLTQIWDLALDDDANPRLLSGQPRITTATISSDNRWVVTGSRDHTVGIWDLTVENPTANQRILTGHRDRVLEVVISPHSRWVISASADKTARIWDLHDENPNASSRILTESLSGTDSDHLVISPDGRWLVIGSINNTAWVWDLTDENRDTIPRVLKGHDDRIDAIAICRDSKLLVTAGHDKTTRIWELNAADPNASVRILRSDSVSMLAISPDQRWLVTGGRDLTTRIWDLTVKDPHTSVRVLSRHQDSLSNIVFSFDGRSILTRTIGAPFHVWKWQWDDLMELATGTARNFTLEEWEQYLPGVPYRRTFPHLPGAGSETNNPVTVERTPAVPGPTAEQHILPTSPSAQPLVGRRGGRRVFGAPPILSRELLRDKSFAKLMDITEGQQLKLNALERERNETILTVFGDNEKLEQMLKGFDQTTVELLTDEQKKIWAEQQSNISKTAWLQQAFSAFRHGNKQRLVRIASELKSLHPDESVLCRKVEHLKYLMALPEPRPLSVVEPEVTSVQVADLKLESAIVGWGQPLRNQVIPEREAGVLIEVAGTFFESGLYSHATARHVLQLDGHWKQFTTKYGLQDGHNGSVSFVIMADGRQLFGSDVVRDHVVREQAVDVSNVKLLELIVTDAGDGGDNDWGVWLDPQLKR